MNEMTDTFAERLSFWEGRSNLGFAAGSGDTNLKKLEIDAIHQSIGKPSSVLDAGCGNGFTLAKLATCFPECRLFGFDYSQGMVDAALELISQGGLAERVSVCRASLLDQFPASLQSINIPERGFDCVYTERSIINLDTFEQQAQAVESLWSVVAPGGCLVLCEAFLDGLNEINHYRESVGLQSIKPPWHNRYLSLSELSNFLPDSAHTKKIIEFSGTYYFVSRVVHAREAQLAGREPSYSADLNIQSLDLPPLPMFGQSKIVLFEKP